MRRPPAGYGMRDRRHAPLENAELRQVVPGRQARDVAFILTEGAKTERYYFEELIDHLRLSSIQVIPIGMDPSQLVSRAKVLLMDQSVDKVFCVFDRDEHAHFCEALNQIRHGNEGRAGRLHEIVSIPSFEYWLLLHFRDTTAPFGDSMGCTAAQMAERALRAAFPLYRKGAQGIYRHIQGLMMQAIVNSKRAESLVSIAATDGNPSTQVHRLVEYLQEQAGR